MNWISIEEAVQVKHQKWLRLLAGDNTGNGWKVLVKNLPKARQAPTGGIRL